MHVINCHLMHANQEGGISSSNVPENLQDEFFKSVVDSLSAYAIVVTNATGIIISWSKGAEYVLGYSEQEIIGQQVGVLFTPEDRERNEPERELQTALQQGQAIDERYHVKKDLTWFWASGLVFPLLGRSGGHIGFVKVMRNVTSVKNNNKLLIDTIEYSKSIIETGNDAFLVMDSHYNVEAANKCFFELFNLREQDIAGVNLITLNEQHWQIPQFYSHLQYLTKN